MARRSVNLPEFCPLFQHNLFLTNFSLNHFTRKNLFPVIFTKMLSHPTTSSEVAQIIFYFWQMAMRAGPEMQQRFVAKVGEISQNGTMRPLIQSSKATVSFNTMKIIELLLAEAAAYELIQNTIFDIIDVFFERKNRNVDHWSITVIMGLIFNNPDFKGPFLQHLFQQSKLLERIIGTFNPQNIHQNEEILPYIKELAKMLPEEVKSPEWRLIEPSILKENGSPESFEISDDLRTRYQKNSKYLKNIRGLKNVLDELELVK